MRNRLQTKEGKKRYALRKQTPEAVFGIIKSMPELRQFLSYASSSCAVSTR
jgi:hypothetical protein